MNSKEIADLLEVLGFIANAGFVLAGCMFLMCGMVLCCHFRMKEFLKGPCPKCGYSHSE